MSLSRWRHLRSKRLHEACGAPPPPPLGAVAVECESGQDAAERWTVPWAMPNERHRHGAAPCGPAVPSLCNCSARGTLPRPGAQVSGCHSLSQRPSPGPPWRHPTQVQVPVVGAPRAAGGWAGDRGNSGAASCGRGETKSDRSASSHMTRPPRARLGASARHAPAGRCELSIAWRLDQEIR